LEDTRRLFYDTVSITGLRAGDPQSINVIPAQALAYADGRILPGQTQQGFLDLMRGALGPEVEVALYEKQFSPGLESTTASPVFRLIRDTVAARCGGATLIPWQCGGSTDAKHLIPLGVPVYGFVPARPLPEGVQSAGAHADNERLWLENLSFALEMIYDIAARYCTQE
jgi:acetylornithine deacetylase/succinyl-diaminopimelate desuccinylase-like protein